jgi:hypothetical protein
MPTRTQREQQMNVEREDVPPTWVEGTETDKPGRAARRKAERAAHHERNLKIARILNG